MGKHSTIPESAKIILAKIYTETGKPLDQLPYTTEFDHIHAEFCAQSRYPATPQETWHELITLRKSGKLPKLLRKGNYENPTRLRYL